MHSQHCRAILGSQTALLGLRSYDSVWPRKCRNVIDHISSAFFHIYSNALPSRPRLRINLRCSEIQLSMTFGLTIIREANNFTQVMVLSLPTQRSCQVSARPLQGKSSCKPAKAYFNLKCKSFKVSE